MAVKEGKKVEARMAKAAPWQPWKNSEPCNFHSFEYRIVPEPRRWCIYKWGNGYAAVPYSERVPSTTTIICTALEELPLESVAPMLDALKQTLRSDEQVAADAQLKLKNLARD